MKNHNSHTKVASASDKVIVFWKRVIYGINISQTLHFLSDFVWWKRQQAFIVNLQNAIMCFQWIQQELFSRDYSKQASEYTINKIKYF